MGDIRAGQRDSASLSDSHRVVVPVTKKVLHIIDGSGYIFRAYYAIRALATAGGESTNAVYGFTTMIEKLLREERPEYLAITFDTGTPTFRREIYPEYKANRSPPPDDLPRQIPRIHEITDAFQIKKFMVGGFEADDVIATLAKRGVDEGFDVQIITGDKDMMQLVSFDKERGVDRVRIYEPMKSTRFGTPEVIEKFGAPPEKLLDVFALCGDASDNIPGVRGVGLKTAAKLITEHGDLDAVLVAAAEGKIKGKIGQVIAESIPAVRLSRRLVDLRSDVPFQFSLEELRYPGPDRARLRELFIELEFRRLIPQIEAALSDERAAEREERETSAEEIDEEGGEERPRRELGARITHDAYRSITTPDALAWLAAELKKAKRIGLALETTTPRLVDAEVIGLALSWEPGQAAYIPLGHAELGRPEQLRLPDVLRALEPVLADPEIGKVSTDLKAIAALGERSKIAVRGLAFDSTIASYLLEPDETGHGSTLVSRRYLGHEPIDRADALGKDKAKATFDQLAVDVATKLAGERAEIAWRATDAMKAELEEADVLNVLKDIELPLVPVLARMELNGVRIDVDQLGGMSSRFADELKKLELACYDAAGKEFNIGSPKQIQKILFEELGLKMIKRTKTGSSTDASVLEMLADSHPLPQAILDCRQVQKLKSTYVDALPKMVSPKTGRVHSTFSQAVAATGRLSSTDPNLQNIPIRSELGRTLRKAFVADRGHLLISVDYSQIELRVLAHFTEEPVLIDAFAREQDVHTRTASVLFEIDPSKVTREQRTQAKAVNFGVLYGMGPVRLARDLKLPRRTASKFIDDYFERQKNVRRYVDETLDSARKLGYVRTLVGRRRLVQDINSQNRGARAAAERVAVNTPIQGSSADLIKLAMIRLDARLTEEQADARLILQVHDELLVEAPQEKAAEVAALVKREMENVYPLKVPLLAEAHVGKSWDDAH